MTEASPSAILQEFRDTNSIMLTEIINTANDRVKHPFKNPKTNKIYFYEPYSLDISGNMGINVWSNPKNTLEEITINPVVDCERVFVYLENLAEIYLTIGDRLPDKW
jgi:hypothetical protein